MHSFVILDFEATCDDLRPPKPQEIIELPSIILRGDDLGVVSEFECFVRPIHNPQLTPFCTELTSITQADVDSAPTFIEALELHRQWLATHIDLNASPAEFLFVTCGDWDLNRMFPAQCKTSQLSNAPSYWKRWINIKESFKEVTGVKGASMPAMLETLGLPLVGRHHRGIDDCRNIAAILRTLAAQGARLHATTDKTAAC